MIVDREHNQCRPFDLAPGSKLPVDPEIVDVLGLRLSWFAVNCLEVSLKDQPLGLVKLLEQLSFLEILLSFLGECDGVNLRHCRQ